MILHTLQVPPSHPSFADCLRIASPADAILLLADGVYGALAGTAGCDALLGCGCPLYILQVHADAAGVQAQDAFVRLDMDGFVELSENYPRQQAWY